MNNGQSAFDYFVGQGLDPVHSAGIVGVLQGESGQNLNPNAVNPGDGRDGSDSIGIGQWNGTRAQALKEYAASKGSPWNDLTTQLEFLHSELKGPEAAAYSRLLASRTPEEAGQAMLAYERPKDWNTPGAHPERGQYAAKAFGAYAGNPTAAPLQLAAPTAPIFAQAPQAAPQPQQQAVEQPAAQFEAPPAASPIFAAKRPQVDLSRLRAAFKAPIFGRG